MLQQMDGWEIYQWIYQYTVYFHNLPYVQVSIKTYLVLKRTHSGFYVVKFTKLANDANEGRPWKTWGFEKMIKA